VNVRRVIYRAGASLKVRFDDRMVAEMSQIVGPGNVRLLGARGATSRAEAPEPPPRERVPVGVGAMDGPDDLDD